MFCFSESHIQVLPRGYIIISNECQLRYEHEYKVKKGVRVSLFANVNVCSRERNVNKTKMKTTRLKYAGHMILTPAKAQAVILVSGSVSKCQGLFILCMHIIILRTLSMSSTGFE